MPDAARKGLDSRLIRVRWNYHAALPLLALRATMRRDARAFGGSTHMTSAGEASICQSSLKASNKTKRQFMADVGLVYAEKDEKA